MDSDTQIKKLGFIETFQHILAKFGMKYASCSLLECLLKYIKEGSSEELDLLWVSWY